MASTIIQFRVDEDTKNKATKIYGDLGVDLSSAIRTFLRRSINENGYPFEMKKPKAKNDEALRVLRCIQAEARINGISNMTLEEINYEISAARKQRKQ